MSLYHTLSLLSSHYLGCQETCSTIYTIQPLPWQKINILFPNSLRKLNKINLPVDIATNVKETLLHAPIMSDSIDGSSKELIYKHKARTHDSRLHVPRGTSQ